MSIFLHQDVVFPNSLHTAVANAESTLALGFVVLELTCVLEMSDLNDASSMHQPTIKLTLVGVLL